MRTTAITEHGRRSTAVIGALTPSLAVTACLGGGGKAVSPQVAAEKAGDFDSYCAFHPFMTAKIRVVK